MRIEYRGELLKIQDRLARVSCRARSYRPAGELAKLLNSILSAPADQQRAKLIEAGITELVIQFSPGPEED